MIETTDLILKKPVFDDWQDMYWNVWSHEETAKFMLWEVTRTKEDAIIRMQKSMDFQKCNDAWFIYEKRSQMAIGFSGITQIDNDIWEDTGIALGPDYVGKGYGKQVLRALCDWVRDTKHGSCFIATCRSENGASRGMILGCGFHYDHSEHRIDPRDERSYSIEFYRKIL